MVDLDRGSRDRQSSAPAELLRRSPLMALENRLSLFRFLVLLAAMADSLFFLPALWLSSAELSPFSGLPCWLSSSSWSRYFCEGTESQAFLLPWLQPWILVNGLPL